MNKPLFNIGDRVKIAKSDYYKDKIFTIANIMYVNLINKHVYCFEEIPGIYVENALQLVTEKIELDTHE